VIKHLVLAAAGAALLSASLAAQPPKQARKATRASDVIKPDHADLAYGPFDRNKLDLWLAKTGRPAPLIVFIHGGGFVNGDKGQASPSTIRRCLDVGVSYAAVNYRFRTSVPIQTVLRDSARAIQYLRSRAEEFGIDKTRLAAMGGSAGAGTSLWLAFHDDLADPKNADPVLRESTRIAAAAATATQATYDVFRWPEFLGDAAAQYAKENESIAFYGFKSPEDSRTPAGLKIRADVDMLGLISKDDPPVYLISSKRHETLDNRGALLHSPLHALAVKKACDAAGVPAIVKISGDERGSGGDPVKFLFDHLGIKEK
jgi:acetyl esterase/lipase